MVKKKTDLKKVLKEFSKKARGHARIAVDLPTAKVVMAVKQKYELFYPQFIREIASKDAKSRQPFYRRLIDKMRKASESADMILGNKGREANESEVETFIELIEEINTDLETMRQMSEDNKRMGKIVDEVEHSTNMQLGTIKQVTSNFAENLNKRKEYFGGLKDTVDTFTNIATGAFEGRTEFGRGGAPIGEALKIALGPFAPLATYGLTAAGKMIGRGLARRRAQRMAGAEIGLIGRELGLSQEDVLRFSKYSKTGRPVGSSVRNPLGYSVSDLYSQYQPGMVPQQEASEGNILGALGGFARINKSAGIVGGVEKKEFIKYQVEAMKDFYSRQAFTVPWTKRVLAALEGRQTSGGGGLMSGLFGASILGGGLLGGLRSSIGKIGPMVLASVSKAFMTTGALTLGYAIGTAIRKIFPFIDKWTTDAMANMIFGWRNLIRGVRRTVNDIRRSLGEEFGEERPTSGQKVSSFVGKTANALSFGLLDADDTSRGIYGSAMKFGKSIPFLGHRLRTDELNKDIIRNMDRLHQMRSASRLSSESLRQESKTDRIEKLFSEMNDSLGKITNAIKSGSNVEERSSSPNRGLDQSSLDVLNMGLLGGKP